MNGGTLSIECPYPYSFTAKALVKELGITVEGFFANHENHSLYTGLKPGVFFDKEHFLADKLVAGAGSKPWPQFFAEAPCRPPRATIWYACSRKSATTCLRWIPRRRPRR